MSLKDKLLECCGDVAYELKELSRKDEALASSYSEFVLAVKELCNLLASACANFPAILTMSQSVKVNAQLLLEVVRAMDEGTNQLSDQLIAKKRIARQLSLLHKEIAANYDNEVVFVQPSEEELLPEITNPAASLSNFGVIRDDNDDDGAVLVTSQQARTLAQSFEKEVRMLSESGRKRAKAPLFRRNLPEVSENPHENDDEPINFEIEERIRQYLREISHLLAADDSLSQPYAEMLNELRLEEKARTFPVSTHLRLVYRYVCLSLPIHSIVLLVRFICFLVLITKTPLMRILNLNRVAILLSETLRNCLEIGQE